ncbi:MAG: hypothetical protein JNM27_15480 [Leptospirales bacterium]|nr:hypothetical protein [Leptospirales bacterium]
MASKFAIELKFPEKLAPIIDIPTLHVLFSRQDDGVLGGHCLDFDIWAYSEQSEQTTAIEHIATRILEMLLDQILYLFSKGSLKNLYANQVPLDSPEWQEFANLANAARVRLLEKSMVKTMDPQQPVEATDEPIRKYDFSPLTEREFDQVKHWLDQLKKATPEKRSEILLAMIKSLRNSFPLVVLSKAG